MEGESIGFLRLADGQSLHISVKAGLIARSEEPIAEITSVQVLQSPEALMKHIQATTDLEIESLEVNGENFSFPQEP